LTPTARSKQELQKRGYRVAIVEHWNAFAKIRQDLFGCIDILAVKEGETLLAVQVTSNAHAAARIAKSQEFAILWNTTGNRFVLHAWAPLRTAGTKKQRRYELKEILLPVLSVFQGAVVDAEWDDESL